MENVQNNPTTQKTNTSELNDFRPISLIIPVIMKCFELTVLPYSKTETSCQMDALQFAYRPKSGVEDTTVTLLNQVYKHLETPSSYVHIPFADLTPAFNTVQADLLTMKLCSMGINHTLIRWIYSL